MRRFMIWVGLFGLAVWATLRALRALDQPAIVIPPPADAPQYTASSADIRPRPDAIDRVPPDDTPLGEDVVAPSTDAQQPGSTQIEAYCAHCRERQMLNDVREETTANGRRAARGACSVCGTTVFTFRPAKQSTES